MTIQEILLPLGNVILKKQFIWQILNIFFCLVIANIFHRINNKYFFSRFFSKKNKERKKVKERVVLNDIIRDAFHRFFYPILHPLFIIIILTIGLSIHNLFWNENIIIISAIKIVILLTFLKILRGVVQNDFLVNIIAFFLTLTLILSAFNIFDPTIKYLDSLAFSFGDIRISIYLVIKSFITMVCVFWLSGIIGKNSKKYIERKRNILPTTKSIVTKFIDIAIYFFIFIIALKTFGVDLTALAVFGGAVGVGVGFGLQKIASNFISGIILLFEKSIETGDIIEIEGAIFGTVKRFSGRYTLIECFDGKEIMMPNEDFIVSRVINWTYSDNKARIHVNIGVAYNTDLDQAIKIMKDCASNYYRCLKDPEIGCYVKEFGDSSINISLYFWVNDINDGIFSAKSDVMLEIWRKFKEVGIVIPFPQREIKILNDK